MRGLNKVLALRLVAVIEGNARHCLVKTCVGDWLDGSMLLGELPLFPLLKEEDCYDGDDEKKAESTDYPADNSILYSGF